MNNQENKSNAETVIANAGDCFNAEMPEVSELKKWYSNICKFGKEVLKANVDYGKLLGLKKPVLFKSGAEKIKKAFNYQIEMLDCVKEVNDYRLNYFDYTYKCIISSKDGTKLGICEGNANSREIKFRYIFKPVSEIPDKNTIKLLKADGKGKWVIEGNKWAWYERVENEDIYTLKNSIQKMAQKRAFVGAVLMASGASEFFAQEI